MEETAGTIVVLAVDDEPMIIHAVAMALTGRGLEVQTATSPQEAKARLAADPAIGVVLADINMPGQTGLDMAAEARAMRDASAPLEMIFMTGEGTTENAIAALRQQAFDFLPKPFRMKEMIAAVERALASNAARRRQARQASVVQHEMREAATRGRALSAELAAMSQALASKDAALVNAEAARAQLFAVISHELRTPLIPIVGFGDIVLRNAELPREAVAEMVGQMRAGGLRLLNLIETALDILALDGREGLAQEPDAPCPPLIEEAIRRSADMAAERAVEVTAHCALDAVTCDPARVGRALGALLENAVKASPKGGRVTITARRCETGGAAFLIEDEGPGPTAGVIGSIGTPFLQGDMTETRPWRGAGLGLAFVKRVADAHGGDFVLESRPVGGALARLRLP